MTAFASRRRARRALAELQQLSDRDLALTVEAVYWRLGYVVKRAAGGELILSESGQTTVVEATGDPNERAVRDAAAARARHGCDRAAVVAPADASRSAKRLARSLGVKIVERHDLSRLIASACDG